METGMHTDLLRVLKHGNAVEKPTIANIAADGQCCSIVEFARNSIFCNEPDIRDASLRRQHKSHAAEEKKPAIDVRLTTVACPGLTDGPKLLVSRDWMSREV